MVDTGSANKKMIWLEPVTIFRSTPAWCEYIRQLQEQLQLWDYMARCVSKFCQGICDVWD